MKNLLNADLTVKGELGERIWKNYARLMEEEYQTGHLFGSLHGWPGDWPGRAILAMCRHARLSGVYPAYIDEIMDKLSEKMEDHGYLGPVSQDPIDEQSVSGHNWMLRGLIEHYEWSGDERSLSMAHRLVQERFLPLKGKYTGYPVDPEVRARMGEAVGTRTGTSANGWELSTDIGCAFMSLDGLSRYYEMTGKEAVGELLEEMIETFMQIDFVDASMQTHASLAATRGVLKIGQLRKHPEYIRFARDFFDLYCQEGMTANFANFNWFGRPYWTEPCAIVDSLILSMELYLETGEASYLEWYNRIYFNALCFAQRITGGFGCDECAAPMEDKEYLQIMDRNYEASWCCTMRGSDGLVYAAEHVLIRKEEEYQIPALFSFDYEDADLSMDVRTSFPQGESLKLTIRKVNGEQKVRIYLPKGVDLASFKGGDCHLEGRWLVISADEPKSIEIRLDHEDREEQVGSYLRYFKGILLQTQEKADTKRFSPYRVPLTGTRSEAASRRFRVLFPIQQK